MLPHPLTKFEIQKYYQNEPKFNGVYSRNNVPVIKDGAYVINLDEYKSIRTHLIVLNVNGDSVTYFDSFGVEYIWKEITKFIGNKNIITSLLNTSKWFNNMWILLYWIYWFYAKRQKLVKSYQFISS